MVLRYKEPSCYAKETKNPNAIYYPLPTNVDRENQSLTSFKFLVVGNRPPGQNAHIASCIQCQTASNSKIIEPLTMTTMPSKPWQVTHGDFCGRFPSGQWGLSLVLIEEHFQFRKMELCLPQICSHTICVNILLVAPHHINRENFLKWLLKWQNLAIFFVLLTKQDTRPLVSQSARRIL